MPYTPLLSDIDPARRVFEAQYAPAESETWLDNPLIEALPGILTDQEFGEVIRFFPPHHPEMREHQKNMRLAYIQRSMQFFAPMEKHLLLYQRFARIIRDGYVARNPITDLGWSRLHQQIDSISEKLKYGVAQYEPPSALGFALIGLGGTGKTVGVNAVLRTYPKMLIHRTYRDSLGREHRLMRTQIVFLKLDCPSDGTLKSLCLNFFQAIDRMTGTTRYYYDYGFKGTRQRTATEMLPDMARVAALHSIGLLIIDEIQSLSKQKSGGQELMLQWFTELVNTIKLPVVLIGTPKANEILNSAFWQMRRNAGQGEGDWSRMMHDAEWERFLRALWRYQFVRHPSPLVETTTTVGTTKIVPPDLSLALYEEAQGIADFAVKMFMVAQERAINSGLECLTPELIHTVAKDAFGKARIILQGIKDNDAKALAAVDDVKFDVGRAREIARPQRASSEKVKAQSYSDAPSPPVVTDTFDTTPILEPILPRLVKKAVLQGRTGVQALCDAGYIASPTEFGV